MKLVGDERAVATSEARLQALILPVALWALWLIAGITALIVVGEGWWILLLPYAGIPAVLLLLFYRRLRTSEYVIGDVRIYRSHGRIRYQMNLTTHDKVTDVHLRQGPLGRIFDFGTMFVETAGSGVRMIGLPDPFGFKEILEETRQAYVQKLIGDYRPEAKKRRGLGEEIATTKPTTASVLVGFIFAGIAAVVGFSITTALLVGNPKLAAIPFGFTILILAGMAVPLYVHLRHTEYELHSGGVVIKRGWLTRRRVETSFDKITDVTTYQGLWGRMLGFGNITINTAGSNVAPVVFIGVKDPDEWKQRIDQLRSES